MTTILEALVVKLGLDSSDLDKKSANAGRKLKDLETSGARVEAGVKKVGKSSKEAASGLAELCDGLKVISAAVGAATAAFAAFAEATINGGAAIDRLSKNLGVSVGDITAWGNAAEQLGGSAKGVQSSMQLLSKAQTDIQLTGTSSLIPYLNMLGVSLADTSGKALKSTDILMQLARAAEGKDRRTMANVFASMGFDDSTINLLLQSRKELELTLKRQKEYADQAAKFAPEATKLQKSIVGIKQQFQLLGLQLLQSASPAIEKVLSVLTSFGNWVQQNSEFIKDFGAILGVIAAGFVAISIATSPITLTVAAITALAAGIALLWQDYQTWKRGGDSLIDWEKWKPGIDAAIAGVKDLGKALEVVATAMTIVKKGFGGDTSGANAASSKLHDKMMGWFGLDPNASLLTRGGRKAIGGAISKATSDDSVTLGVGKAMKLANGQSVTSEYAMKYFMDRGMSRAEAAGLASQIHSESSGKANAVGDHGAAYGLIQWHKDRQENFKKQFGHDIQQSTADEQLAFIVHEVTVGTERGAGARLKGATSAEQAGEIASKFYVRPADVQGEASRRGSYAAQIAGIPGATNTVAAAGNPASSSMTTNNNDHGVTIHGDVRVETKATDGPGIVTAFKNGMNGLLVGQAVPGLS